MSRRFTCWTLPLIVTAALLTATSITQAQRGATNGEWHAYGGDGGSTHYSPLDQITAQNFNSLQVAWRFNPAALGDRPDFNMQATPLMVNGVLYFTAGSRRDAVALDARTGEMLWMYRLDEGKRAEESVRKLSGRGVGYWSNGRGDDRIYFVSIGYQLVCLNAKNGQPVTTFGVNGVVDLKQNNDQLIDAITGEVGWNGSPVIARNVVMVGAAHDGGQNAKSFESPKGYIRGFDVLTGKRLWIFHTVPQVGEVGSDTWLQDSASYTGNTGVWAQFTVDETLGIAYLPVESPTGDYYGGHRPGANLFAESLVAVDVQTGKRIWHYQFVHHPMWDYDLPCAPILADITIDGRLTKVVAQPTKQGWLYVFDRQTGKPIWPIEERPVEKGNVPGEWYSPTQPFVTKPPAFERQGFSTDEVIDFTPELKAEALKIVSQYKIGPIYTPLIARGQDGKIGTLYVPNGANWPGGSLDPDTGIVYIYSHTLTRVVGLISDPQRSTLKYFSGGGVGDRVLTVQGLPITRPPWGRITAIDLNKGEIVWQIAHGETPDYVKNHPALKGLNIPRTGRPAGAGGSSGGIGILTTKTLVISGEGGIVTTANGQRGAMLRAYDKRTGREVGAVYMPASQTGTPMTYMSGGQQYIVVSTGGGSVTAELMAYKLPQ